MCVSVCVWGGGGGEKKIVVPNNLHAQSALSQIMQRRLEISILLLFYYSHNFQVIAFATL